MFVGFYGVSCFSMLRTRNEEDENCGSLGQSLHNSQLKNK